MWKPVILDVECIVCNKSLQKINDIPRINDCNKMGKIIKINNNRRVRTPNWSLEEKQFLLQLIKQHKDIVVTKTNNGPNYYEEKDVAWNEILRDLTTKFGEKFNDSSITIKKIKTQWQNMKRIAREEVVHNGPMLQNYTRLSMEVCNIIDLIKDGVLVNETENVNENPISTNVEIKTEYIEEEANQPSCSGINSCSTSLDADTQSQNQHHAAIDITMNRLDSSTSSNSDGNDYEMQDRDNFNTKCNASVMTDTISVDETGETINPLHREIQQFIQYTAAEKKIKLESLKEERQVIRAMRETAELNKIIAEQRLKHVLWIKKQEMQYVLSSLLHFCISKNLLLC